MPVAVNAPQVSLCAILSPDGNKGLSFMVSPWNIFCALMEIDKLRSLPQIVDYSSSLNKAC